MIKINWLVPYDIKTPNDIKNANLASIRLRSALFLNESFKKFHIDFNNFDTSVKFDHIFVAKMAANTPELQKKWLHYLNLIKKNKTKIYLDYTDNHLINDNSPLNNFYTKIINDVDTIITSSKKLKEDLNNIGFTKEILTIEDPFEIEAQPPIKNNNNVFLWFGHQSNVHYFIQMIKNWPLKKNVEIIVLTSDIGHQLINEEMQAIKISKYISFSPFLWSQPKMIEASKLASGILIPGNSRDPKKNGVSNNRLVTSFALGLPVAATLYDSYSEFKEFFCNIDNVNDFAGFIADPTRYENKLDRGRKLISKYSIATIEKKWLALIN